MRREPATGAEAADIDTSGVGSPSCSTEASGSACGPRSEAAPMFVSALFARTVPALIKTVQAHPPGISVRRNVGTYRPKPRRQVGAVVQPMPSGVARRDTPGASAEAVAAPRPQ